MIVSAIHRADIPAFYERWFLRRREVGFCRVGGGTYIVSLVPGRSTASSCGPRNLRPLLADLTGVRTVDTGLGEARYQEPPL